VGLRLPACCDCGFKYHQWHGCLSLVSVMCCQKFLRWADNLSRGVLPSVVCLRWGLHKATLHATCQRVQSPPSQQAWSKLVMPVTCRNEMAGQSASSISVHHSTNISAMNCKILVLYHKILTGCIYYLLQ